MAVAAHPEKHPDAPDLETDRRHLLAKLRHADLAITQFFFRIEDYLSLVDWLGRHGMDKPVLPGIMPITNARTVTRMAQLSGAAVPVAIAERIEAVADRPSEVHRIGVDIATEMCEKLLAEGVPGLHLYTMNQSSATLEICAAPRFRRARLVSSKEGVMAIFAVTTAKGPNWQHDRGMREQQSWDEHAALFDDLVERGVVLFGGPIGGSDEDVALLAVEGADEPEIRSIFRADPWAASAVLRVKEVRPWTIWLGRPQMHHD